MASDQNLLGWTKLVIAVVGSTILAAAALYQYVSTSDQTARQPFLEKQTALCFQASETAARLATTDQADQWQKSWDDFWVLYWGPLAIIENTSSFAKVAKAMVDFGNLIKPLGRSAAKLPASNLEVPAMHVSQACQQLVTSWWEPGKISKWLNRLIQ
jgi:hypothetical protein